MAGAILLFLHIFAGSVALLGALVALVAAKGRRYHILLGRVYAIAMTVIFLTSLPLAILDCRWRYLAPARSYCCLRCSVSTWFSPAGDLPATDAERLSWWTGAPPQSWGSPA